jgi:hypothetical protein
MGPWVNSGTKRLFHRLPPIDLSLPWFADALGRLPEDLALGFVWASVLLRLGWVTLSIAPHPQAWLLPHLLPRRKRWLVVAILLLALLAFTQTIVLVALAALWIDALRTMWLQHSP